MAETDPSTESETVERVIPASPEKIFALIADPTRHKDIDGSGSVRDAKKAPERLELGSTFGMSMKMGIPYSMVNTVIEYQPNRCIAWQTRPPIGKSLAGGRIWKYELEPVDGGTRVRETWDYSQEKGMKGIVSKAGEKTRKNMEATLEQIEKIVTSS